jgi:uncharacterized membrane protein
MMTFLILVVGIVIFIMLLNLRGRIEKLEYLLKNSSLKENHNYQNQSQQSNVNVDSNFNSLISYIKQQISLGVSKDDIKNILIKNNWKVVDIENAFSSITLTSQFVEPASIEEVDSLDRFINWLKEDWLLKLGAFLLLIGFGWLTTYAFLNNWVGPMGRIALGIFAGIFFLILGWWRIKKYLHQGGIFLVLGSTTVLLTVFAAREIYSFFTPLSALGIMFLSIIFVTLISIKYNSRTLVLTSLVLAGVAPLFTNISSLDYVWLFSYLLIVVLGTVWVVAITGKREVTLAALILVVLYSLPYIFSVSSADKATLLIFEYAFAIIFFLTNTIGISKLKDKDISADLITAALNGLFLLTWIIVAAQEEWKSMIIFTWMIIFIIGAFLVYKITQRKEPFYVYAGVGIAMLAAVTSIELSGATLVIFYTIESAIISLVTYLFLKDMNAVKKISVLLIGPVILSFGSIASQAWNIEVFQKDFFVLLILGVTLFILGLFFLRQSRESGDKNSQQFNEILLIAGSIYFYVILWLSLHTALENKNTAVMICLVVYTIIGLITYFYGLLNSKKDLQIYGGAIIGFVVGRLLFVDIWGMELTGKIATFFMIGALLVSTAFIGNKKKISALSEEIK